MANRNLFDFCLWRLDRCSSGRSKSFGSSYNKVEKDSEILSVFNMTSSGNGKERKDAALSGKQYNGLRLMVQDATIALLSILTNFSPCHCLKESCSIQTKICLYFPLISFPRSTQSTIQDYVTFLKLNLPLNQRVEV